MSNMASVGLKAIDICRIIRECKDVGVTELQYGDLHIQFTPQGPAGLLTQSQSWSEIQSDAQTKEVRAQEQTQIDDQFGAFDEQAAEDAMYSQLMIDDPAAFEKLQMLEGLETARVGNEKA